MKKHAPQNETPEVNTDLLWGGAEIAAYLRLKPAQFYYLHGRGIFGDAVVKHGHRMFAASKRALAAKITPSANTQT